MKRLKVEIILFLETVITEYKDLSILFISYHITWIATLVANLITYIIVSRKVKQKLLEREK